MLSSPRLQYYRQHQQDALRYTWEGLIAGTDWSVDEKTERMGAGYLVGVGPNPTMTLSIRVGGPLATTRAEAACLPLLFITVRAVRMRSTVFVKDLFHRPVGATVSSCRSAEYRVWLRCMMGIYPTQTYLHRVGLAHTQFCPHYTSTRDLAQLACVCPQFREARTSAHNKVRTVITSFFFPLVGPQWKVYEESPMSRTGLILCCPRFGSEPRSW
jgi:hypothetical protein